MKAISHKGNVYPMRLCNKTIIKFLLFVFVLLTLQSVFAQQTFQIKSVSKEYDLFVRVVENDEQKKLQDYVEGSTQISFYKKGRKHPVQVLRLPKVIVSKENIAFNSKINTEPRSLYAKTYSFVSEDFDFDGYEDLAV
jgi:hypothetical protein